MYYSGKTTQILHKSCADVNQSELIFYFRYVICMVHPYKILLLQILFCGVSCCAFTTCFKRAGYKIVD